MEKYVLHTNDVLNLEHGCTIEIDDRQVLDVLKSLNIELFECEYNSDYYFIIASDEQLEKLKIFSFVEWIEKYNEDYFIYNNILDNIKYKIDNLEYGNDNEIDVIEILLKKLKKEKTNYLF